MSTMSPWESGQGPSSRVTGDKPSLDTLPSEILKTILSYTGVGDLANLAAVSHSFHELASAELYRNVHQCFPDYDRSKSQPSVDRLAAILETLITGAHDYARFVKSMSIDAESDGCASQTARDFKYDHSAGKFLNTLMLAALKKIPALESFRWNIRVEIGHSIFLVLSKLLSLKDLHVRLQSGPALHSPSITDPRSPLPQSTQFDPPHVVPIPAHLMHQHHGGNMYVPHTNPSSLPYSQPLRLGATKSVRATPRLLLSKSMSHSQNFSRLSGLRSLSVLDIDSYEYIPELSACVSSSSASLKSLKLSISESAALKARRRAAPNVADAETAVEDVDSDDFFNGINIPPPPPLPVPATGSSSNPAATSSSTQAEVRKERATQEEALAQILGVTREEDPADILHEQLFERSINAAYRELQLATEASFLKGHDHRFVAKVKEIAEKLFANQKGASYQSDKTIRALEMIEKAAATYLEDHQLAEDLRSHTKPHARESGASKNQNHNGESGVTPVTASSLNNPEQAKETSNSRYYEYLAKLCEDPSHPPAFPFDWNDEKDQSSTQDSKNQSENTNLSSSDKLAGQIVDCPFEPSAGGSGNSSGIFGGENNQHGDNMSDIVDMEHPDNDGESGDDQQSADDSDEWNTRKNGSEIGADVLTNNKGKQPIGNNRSNIQGAVGSSQEALLSDNDPVQQYLKSSHGLCLDSLAIYLLPVKASVLAKGLDISNLKHLSLLNVGSQGRFWSMLSKFYLPLKLTSIHTDNVTHEFLHVLDDLAGVTELFLFERSRNSKVPSLAPRTTVDIEHLRTHVLKMHMQSLRRLVIRNEDDSAWVFNRKSVLALGRHGGQLNELMIGLDSESLHLFMQHLTRFRSLHALQILFHSRENCFSVVQELRYSIADTVIHCPMRSVRYVSVCPSPMTLSYGAVSHLITEFEKTGLSPRCREYMNNEDFGHELPTSGLKSLLNDKSHGYSSGVSRKGKVRVAHSAQNESSDDELDVAPTQMSIARHDVRVCDVVGVKMWERENWAMKL